MHIVVGMNEIKDLLSTIDWIIRKHKKGDTPEETVRMLLLHEDEIKKIINDLADSNELE